MSQFSSHHLNHYAIVQCLGQLDLTLKQISFSLTKWKVSKQKRFLIPRKY